MSIIAIIIAIAGLFSMWFLLGIRSDVTDFED